MDITSLKHKWTTWLLSERHISLDVAREAGLKFSDTSLTIPIKDKNGVEIFSKYRRAPWMKDGPKYTYEHGSKAALYGVEHLATADHVFVVEGEMDALALRSLGYTAVSSTGGAGTFSPDWVDYFTGKKITIIYDADKAGVEGAVRVASIIPWATIAWLPVQYGKDITDVIHNEGLILMQERINNARNYRVPSSDADIETRIAGYKDLITQFFDDRLDTLNDPANTPMLADIGIAYAEEQLAKAKKELAMTKRRKSKPEENTELEAARTYPIAKLVKVNGMGKAQCPYHEDSTPSMQVYSDNHAFSYCCGKRSDAISLYMFLNQCDFKKAVSDLSHGTT